MFLHRTCKHQNSPAIEKTAVRRLQGAGESTAGLSLTEAVKAQWGARRSFPLERIGEPEDIANLVVFLSDPASWIAGDCANVDGGWTKLTPRRQRQRHTVDVSLRLFAIQNRSSANCSKERKRSSFV
jgi:hypothetical protein